MKRFQEMIARFVQNRPRFFIVIAVVLSLAAIPGITMLQTESGYSSLVSGDSNIFIDTARYEEEFGGESITILLSGLVDNVLHETGANVIDDLHSAFGNDGRVLSILDPIRFPNLAIDERHAMIVVNPVGSLSDETILNTISDIERFFTANPIPSIEVSLINDSKFVSALSTSIQNGLALLLGLSVIAMALILFFLFRVRWRLLSLFMVGTGVLWAFGIMGYFSIPLSMATMAALPILFGLGIDYSIQFHNRYQEEIVRSVTVAQSIVTSIARIFPVAGLALLATAIGFIALFISDMPMVRDFGIVLLLGISFCYFVALLVLLSIIYLGDRNKPLNKLQKAAVGASGRIERALAVLGRISLNHPLPMLLIALTLGISGGVLDQMLPTNTDIEKLAPQDLPELQEVRQLREIIGYDGELLFMVEAEDVTDPDFLRDLKEYQESVLSNYPELMSVNSPAALIASATNGEIPDRPVIEAILKVTPEVYVDQVISADRQIASLSFTTEFASLEEISNLARDAEQIAAGYPRLKVTSVGSITIASMAVDSAVSTRGVINSLYLVAVFLVLLVVYRRLTSTAFAVASVGLVIAWTSLAMYLMNIPLNPMTAIMGVIIIGIGTEFMVLLLGRYQEEKNLGARPREAMLTAISKIGRAIVTTALTTLGGFVVLIASDFVMIRDFGIATSVSVFLCLVSAIAVMPPLIVWLDNRILRKN